MKVLIDGDACPVTNIAASLCREYAVSCLVLCDTAHAVFPEGATTFIVDKGADSVDFALLSRVERGDVVITQDYGLASMCLARGGIVVHQDGWLYSEDNMDALLHSRHESARHRRAGGRSKGPKKRTREQDAVFYREFQQILQGKISGGSIENSIF